MLPNGNYKSIYELTVSEREEMSKIWERRENVSVKRPRKHNFPSLVVSDAHRASILIRYNMPYTQLICLYIYSTSDFVISEPEGEYHDDAKVHDDSGVQVRHTASTSQSCIDPALQVETHRDERHNSPVIDQTEYPTMSTGELILVARENEEFHTDYFRSIEVVSRLYYLHCGLNYHYNQ
jgi:hypothetical protein